MILIGFTGPPGAGKDTAFKILHALLFPEWNIRRYSFADPIRHIADQMMSLPRGEHRFWEAELKDEKLEAFNGHTPREMLIDLGMMGRKYRPDIWIYLAIERIMNEKPDVAVITDVRFDNEGAKLRSMGAEIIEIRRLGHDYDATRRSESGEAVKYATRTLLNPGHMAGFQHIVEDAWWRIRSEREGGRARA